MLWFSFCLYTDIFRKYKCKMKTRWLLRPVYITGEVQAQSICCNVFVLVKQQLQRTRNVEAEEQTASDV